MNMKENNSETITRAVVPLFVWSEPLEVIGIATPVGKIGTAFFIEYENELYAITATHCLKNTSPKDIFIAIPGDDMKSLPISTVIGSSYKDLPHIDTEISVIKMPLLDVLLQRIGNYPYILSQEIINTPYIKRQIRLFRKGRLKSVYDIINSNFYQNMKKTADGKIQKALQRLYPPELKILNLRLSNSANMLINTECQLLGYPNAGFNINYDEPALTTLFRGMACKFLGYDTNTRDYVFQYETDEDLNGCSGGPIIYDNQVVAVAHSVIKTEKLIKATPFSKQFMQNLSAAQASK